MIIAAFKGYVGNQLFQYAAARKIAIDNNTELKLDINNWHWQRPYGREHENSWCLQFFNVQHNLATQKEAEKFRKKDLFYYFERIFMPRNKRRYVWEKNWEFDEALVGLKRKNVYIYGQFQSPEYFMNIEDILRKELTFKEPQGENYDKMMEKIKNTSSVSVHIRRNDFILDKKLANIYYQLPLEYYKKAFQIIGEKVKNPTVFVFSDDIEWVKNNLPIPFPVEYVSDKGFRDYQEVILMGACKHNVTANSTFSWWGAWLGTNKDKVVVTSKTWYNDTVKNERYVTHLIPEDWIKI
jgi:hypothetical protein